MMSSPRIAFVVDALPAIGGGEKTLFTALEAFPRADIFTLIYNRGAFRGTPIAQKAIVTSYLDRLPFARTHYRLLLPLMPFAIESFDLSRYDIVVSFSYAVAHGARAKAGTRRLAYMYTPMRYAWRDLNLDGTLARKNALLNRMMQQFRTWDRAATSRVHEISAISHGIAERIRYAYRREAQVIYPPVETERFSPDERRDDFFMVLTRLVPHKRIDLVVEAFAHLQLPLKIVGEGPEKPRLREKATPNIEFLGFQPEETVARLLNRARGFICAAEEDFGIAIVEAQAAGCPVIAYQSGGALETVIDGVTGIFFPQQAPGSVMKAVRQFQDMEHRFRRQDLVANARKFCKARFTKSFQDFVG